MEDILIDKKEWDKISENLLSEGIKIVYKGRTYNVYGHSKERGYLVICTPIQEKDFLIGNEFDRTIPVGLSHVEMDKSLYYRKINLDEVEDVFTVEIECIYDGITCLCSILKNEKVIAIWEKASERCANITDEKELIDKGFVEKKEAIFWNDRAISERIFYLKDNISMSDNKIEIKAYKKYISKIASPYDKCRRKHIEKTIYLDMDFKQVYYNLLSSLKGE